MIFGLSKEQYELYKKAEEEVSNEHPYKCVCGRITTGLHERNCSKFRKSVERRYFKLLKKENKENKYYKKIYDTRVAAKSKLPQSREEFEERKRKSDVSRFETYGITKKDWKRYHNSKEK